MTKIAGVTQSQEHAKAARTLSDALAYRRSLSETAEPEDVWDADLAVEAARRVLQKAYLKYTNPFGVRKTV